MLRSTLGRFVALQFALAAIAISAFTYFAWHRMGYLLARRDDQIVARELSRIGGRGDLPAARADLDPLKAGGQPIAPGLFYLPIPNPHRFVGRSPPTIRACMG